MTELVQCSCGKLNPKAAFRVIDPPPVGCVSLQQSVTVCGCKGIDVHQRAVLETPAEFIVLTCEIGE